MNLSFLYHPVEDVGRAVAFYRDVLGLDEAWRMGDDTAAMQLPDSDITVMLSIDEDPDAPASGFFGVEDVDTWVADHRDRIDLADEPQDLPPIRYASFRDPDGNVIRIFHELPEAAE
jgi:catechol 2,3-dioxygenase-like lactoylglutathione lyase family enzyme